MALDPAALLIPFDGDIPSGADLRQDFSPASLYFRMRDARSDARAAERASDADPGSEANAAQSWREVASLAREALSRHAKDIEVAAWLTEAMIRQDGLAGLAAGARLIGGLAAEFWDTLYPLPDEDGMATRVAPITGLNGGDGDGTLIQPLRKIKLFDMPDGQPLLYFQYQQSAELLVITDTKRLESRRAAGIHPYDAVQSAARAADKAALKALRTDLASAQREWAAMEAALDQRAGADAPQTGKVSRLLAEIDTVIKRYSPDAPAAEQEQDQEVVAVQPGEAPTGTIVPAAAGRPLRTREDALGLLADLALFFRRTEPQSPLSYTLDEAVRRARMPWPELLQEVITDDDTRRNVMLRLGIKPVTSE